MRRIIIAYIPVLHLGYLNFIVSCGKVDTLYVLGTDFAKASADLDYITRKDAIRAIPEKMMKDVLLGLGVVGKAEVLDHECASALQREKDLQVVLLDEDYTRFVAQRYFFGKEVEFKKAFVRWHRDNVLEERAVAVHRSLPVTHLDQELMSRAREESGRSWDWWRQVGGLVAKDGQPILVAHNKHVPDEQMPYAFGDPRSIFKRGVHIELSTAEHAEAILVAEAARRGISLNGASLYVTDFPCPTCAKLVADAGIARCYFMRGYAVLDGETSMKEKGVELVYIATE